MSNETKLRQAIRDMLHYQTPMGSSFNQWYQGIQEIGYAALNDPSSDAETLEQRKARAFDWLITKPAYVAHSSDGDDCWVHWAYDPSDEERGPYNGPIFSDPLEAVEDADCEGGEGAVKDNKERAIEAIRDVAEDTMIPRITRVLSLKEIIDEAQMHLKHLEATNGR